MTTAPDPVGRSTDAGELSHVRADGTAHMVDVTAKQVTSREASARAVLVTREDVVARIASGDLPKGEALATARLAGIMGAKRTAELIPLCHPLPITKVTVDFELDTKTVTIFAPVKTRGLTGVEMEALTAASVAALPCTRVVIAAARVRWATRRNGRSETSSASSPIAARSRSVKTLSSSMTEASSMLRKYW